MPSGLDDAGRARAAAGLTQPSVRYLDHREGAWRTFVPRFDMHLSASASGRPLGATYLGEERGTPRTAFLVWAPRWIERGVRVAATLPSGERVVVALAAEADDEGFFLGEGAIPPGARYRYETRDGQPIAPDPASLAHDKASKLSVVVDRAFVHDVRARLRRAAPSLPQPKDVHLIAQVHPGTSGGFARSAELCAYYRQMGFQAVQTLPETLFPGRFNAGYDVCSLFAVEPAYGSPEALAESNARAAELGIVRITDRVHNHIYPANLLECFAPYFGAEGNEWGRGPTREGLAARAARRYHREADVRWLDDLGFLGLRHDATFRVDDELNRQLASDAELTGALLDLPILTIAEDNHNDRRVTRRPSRDESALGFVCQYAPDKRHSALAIALLVQRQAITKHYLKAYVGLGEHEDPRSLYAAPDRFRQAFERAFRLHVTALRQGMALEHVKAGQLVPLEPPGEQPPWATLAPIEYHDGPQNNEAGQFIAAELGAARTATHYLAHAVGPETKLVFRGAEEVVASKERRFGWLADLSAVDKLNAAMGRHLGDLGGDPGIRPPWDPAFQRCRSETPCYLADPDAQGWLTWDNWRVSWVIARAREMAERMGTADILRPDLLRAGEPVPEVEWDRYFAQVASTGLQLVDFAGESALGAYGFDPELLGEAGKRAREAFRSTFAEVIQHVPLRDWHCLQVIAWDELGAAVLQRWDPVSGNRLLFVENLAPDAVEIRFAAQAAYVGGRRGRIEALGSVEPEDERDYALAWSLRRTSADAEWGGDCERGDAGSAPERLDLRGDAAPDPFHLGPGHALLYLSERAC